MDTLTFVISCLAVWRISNLFANESGPFHIFKRLRVRARYLCVNNRFCRRFHLYELVSCEYCNSMWFGTALAAYYLADNRIPLFLFFPYALAFSTATILIKVTHELLVESKNWFMAARKALETKS